MLENFIFSVNSVIPIFMVMALGYLIRKFGWMDAPTFKNMNTVVFKIGIPVLLFRDVSRSNVINEPFDVAFVVFCLVSTFVVFIVTWWLAYVYFKNRKYAGTFALVSFRSNFVMLGLPLTAHILGDMGTGMALLPIAFVVPLYNILSAVALAGDENEKLQGLRGLKVIITNVFNPMLYGILVGAAVSLSGLSLPVMVNVPVDYIAVMTTPMALLVVGGSIDISKVRSRYKPALAVTFVKLVVSPLIVLPLAIWVGFSTEALVVLLILFGTPTAISTYAIVTTMGGDEELALNSIMLSMLFAMFSLTIGLFMMRTLGLL